MPSVTLDLKTKVIGREQNIWSVFPGRRKRFLEAFANGRAVFLDMPGLRLSERVLNDDELLRKHLAMSQAIRRWHLSRDADAPPTRNPTAYAPRKSPAASAQIGNIRSVYQRMKPGDLVVMAGERMYDPILIGEVQSRFDPEDNVRLELYGREQIPARKVRWLSVRMERRFLSIELSQLLSNRKAVISIDKERFGDVLFRAAYGDYVYGENSRYAFLGPDYRNIGLALIPGIKLISYFCAASNAAELNELETFGQLDISEAIDTYFEQDYLKSFKVDFSSPGEYVLLSRRAVLPLVVAALVSVTAGGVNYADARTAHVKNSAEAAAGQAPQCSSVQIEQQYQSIMTSINADRYNQLCALNKEAQDGVGLKVPVKKQIRNP